MRTAAIFGILAIGGLAACQIELTPPPGPDWGGRPPAGQIDVAGAERACVAQARFQGLRVRNVGRTEIVTGSRGRVIGTQTILRVTRGGRSYPVRCNYTFDSRIARITSIRRG
jgi:hypothetical protein